MYFHYKKSDNCILKKLTRKSLIANKKRNRMVVAAIALAAFLLSICASMVCSFWQSQKKLSDDTFEFVYYHLCEDQISDLKKRPEIGRVAVNYILGEYKTSVDETLALTYMDKNAYYTSRNQYRLADGTLPVSGDEIAASKSWIEKYTPDIEIGDPLTLILDQQTYRFTLSAILTFPAEEQGHYSFLVTKHFLKDRETYHPAGYNAYVHFKHADTVSKDVIQDMGQEIAKEMNLSYDLSTLFFSENKEVSAGNTLLLLGISLLVLFAGVTVIQSIFRISIYEKIRTYGQLRTIGATRKQIASIVKREGRVLAFTGILFGIIPGNIMGTLLGSNALANGFHFQNILLVTVAVSVICISMAAISIHTPVKLASAAAPLAVLRYAGQTNFKNSRRKHPRKISPVRLGMINIGRDKKAAASTFVSIVLGGLLLFLCSSVAVTYSPEQDVRTRLFSNGGSFRIYLSDPVSIRQGNPFGQELQQNLSALKGIEKVIPIRDSIGECSFSTDEMTGSGMCDIISSDGAMEGRPEFITKYLTQGRLPADKTEILAVDLLQEVCPVSLGDHVQLTINGKRMEVIISGFYDASYVGTVNGQSADDGANLMITKELAYEFGGKLENFTYTWEAVAAPSFDRTVQEELYSMLGDKGISICSFEEELRFTENQMNLLFGGLQVLPVMILFFAIINLVNMMLSLHHSQRHEISMMRSIGLTRKQAFQMLEMEGLFYILFCLAVVFLIGFPISFAACHYMESLIHSVAMPYQFPFLQMGFYCLALLILQFVLSVYSIKSMNRRPLIEQLRSIQD